jgi:GNAT superfamily N-acetyltransferase
MTEEPHAMVKVERLRVGAIADVEEMLRLSDAAPGLLGTWSPTSRYEALTARIDGVLVGVLSGSYDSDFNEGVSFCGFDLPPAPHGYLSQLHVHKDYRRQGVGHALVVAYADAASDRGCTFLGGSLDLSDDPAGRDRFFRACGFRVNVHDNFGAALETLRAHHKS